MKTPFPRRTRRARPVAAALFAGATLLGACGRSPRPGEPIPGTTVLGGLGDTPGRFAYPRAIDRSADGASLWVIDRSARVQRIDPETGRCTTIWKMPDSEVGKPVGFSIAPGRLADGSWAPELLYIADTHYHRVMIYQPPPPPDGREAERTTGEPVLVASFGSFGEGPGQFLYPTDVAVLLGPDGRSVERLYVGEYGGNDRVSVFDGEYRFLYSFGEFGGGTDPAELVFNRPQSLEIVEIEGHRELIVTDACNHRLGRFTLDGKLVGWIGSPAHMGSAPGRFNYPYGLESLGDGTVMVSEFGGNRVQRIDLATGESLGVWGRAGRGEGELMGPWGVAVLGRKTYVLDSNNNRVVAFAGPRRK